jgi:hypothetical protein
MRNKHVTDVNTLKKIFLLFICKLKGAASQ